MDDHHPAGIYFPRSPTIFHPAPSPFGIPYRSLYSRNVRNLLFAGRNISVTHAALSSTRVMGTCALLGQAAGTAAALCVKHSRIPRDLNSGAPLRELQATIMEDDCGLPGLRREISKLAQWGSLASDGRDAALLQDGLDRDRKGENHAWSGHLGASINLHWSERQKIEGLRLVLDSDLNMGKCMPCSYPRPSEEGKMPGALIKAFRLEALDVHGKWQTVFRKEENRLRLVTIPLSVETKGLRLVADETWGHRDGRVFAFEPLASRPVKSFRYPEGETFTEIRSKISPQDLNPAESVIAKA